jgi:plastocyanin
MSKHDHLAVSAGWLRSPAGRVGTIFAGSLIALSVLAGCGSSSKSATPPPANSSVTASDSAGGSSTAAAAPMIHIDKFKYSVPASVAPGEKVSVMNMDGEAHTVTSDSGAFDDMATAGTITTFTAPSKPGSYPFHCTFHSNMHGVLVVK